MPSDDFSDAKLETLLRATGQELGLNGRQFFGALRTAITGRTATPPLFEMMAVMGPERVQRRLVRSDSQSLGARQRWLIHRTLVEVHAFRRSGLGQKGIARG